MKFAFADPPYLGCGALYDAHHAESRRWDDLGEHKALVDQLVYGYSDGWVLCLSSPSMRHILPFCPEDCRVGAWVKPFAVFKPNVNPAYAWEPVIWRGGRKGDRTRDTVRDWFAKEITLERGLIGAKPAAFCGWVLDLLGFEITDEVHDLFPGTGIMGDVVAMRRNQRHSDLPLFHELVTAPTQEEKETVA